jgi:hypothetical protein
MVAVGVVGEERRDTVRRQAGQFATGFKPQVKLTQPHLHG